MKPSEIIADRSRWTTTTMARDHRGRSVSPVSPRAYSFSAMGVIWHCYPDFRDLRFWWKKCRLIAQARHDMTLDQVNNRLGYEEAYDILVSAGI